MSHNWDEFRCRCSGIHRILANSRSNPVLTEKQAVRLKELENKADLLTAKQLEELAELMIKKENSSKVILSDTCIEYLMEAYAWATERKRPLREQFEVQQMKKGKLAEEDSITLISVIEGNIYIKNTEQVSNDFLTGEPDVFLGDNVMNASKITDIKTCWDYPIFLKKINGGLDNGNEEQVQGYCEITGASEGQVAYTLVNMPEIMRIDFKKKLFYAGDYVTEESPEFLRKWAELENDMMFDNIALHKRLFKVPIQRFTDFQRQQVYDRVKVCRDWLWKFDEMYQQLNIQLEPIENATT